MIEKLTQDALIIWATIDPIGTMALFAALTAHLTPTERRRTAFKAIGYAALVLIGSIVIGQVILSAMGIRLVSFQIAGGIILFLFGLASLWLLSASSLMLTASLLSRLVSGCRHHTRKQLLSVCRIASGHLAHGE